MWLESGGRPRRFTAVQLLDAERIAFSWRARFPIAGPLALDVVDAYAGGVGELTVRLLGIPVQRQRGPETTVGEALRYLAELPFVPPARTVNPELEWSRLDTRSLEVAAHVGGDRLAVTIELDDAGDIIRTSSRMRMRKAAGTWVATPWGGEFHDYAALGGVWLPTRAEAYWEIAEARDVYWRAEIVNASLLAAP